MPKTTTRLVCLTGLEVCTVNMFASNIVCKPQAIINACKSCSSTTFHANMETVHFLFESDKFGCGIIEQI